MDDMSRLLDGLVTGGAPLSISIREAFESVHPEYFTSYPLDSFWKDHPVPFIESEGGGVKTISAPHMLVELLHHSEITEGDAVLIVGAKGGYLAALISHIIGDQGDLMVIDPSAPVVEHLRLVLNDHATASGSKSIRIRKVPHLRHKPPGLPAELKRIIITGSIESLPSWVERVLGQEGIVLAPIGDATGQVLTKFEFLAGRLMTTPLAHVVFGPVELPQTSHTDVIELIAAVGRRAVHLGLELKVLHQREADHLLMRLTALRTAASTTRDAEALLEEHSVWLMRLWPLIEKLSEEPDMQPLGFESGVLFGHDDLVP